MKKIWICSMMILCATLSAYCNSDTSYQKFIKNLVKREGLFTFYSDTVKGLNYLEIANNQLDRPFIFTTRIQNAAPETFLFQGDYLNQGLILRLRKNANKIIFSLDNTGFYIPKSSSLAQVKDANVVPEILSIEDIQTSNEKLDHFIIKLDSIFLSEKLCNFKLYYDPEFPLKPEDKLLGDFNFANSRITQIKAFESNIVIKANLNFRNNSLAVSSKFSGHKNAFGGIIPYNYIGLDISYIVSEIPQKPFEQRTSNPCVGFWTNEQEDLISTKATPWHDYISRWRLEKKDINKEVSDPVKPILFYLDNATPPEWRQTIIQAVEKWNIAFESAGFSNAIRCQMEPDSVEYDMDDLSRNMILWTTGAAAGFIGFGPSISNPLTGEILGADIILDYAVMYPNISQDLIKIRNLNKNKFACYLTDELNMDQRLAKDQLNSIGTDDEIKKMKSQVLEYLVLHEVGHTLGMTHNFKGSYYLSPEELRNPEIVKQKGLAASVMDYYSAHIESDKSKQSDYYLNKPGKYDMWAINYAYSPSLKDPNLELERLKNIANQSDQLGLAYGNDSDASDESTAGIDPNIVRLDMSSDPLEYSRFRLEFIKKYFASLNKITNVEDESKQAFIQKTNSALRGYLLASNIIAGFIGGVHFERSQTKEKLNQPALLPVPLMTQKKAMKVLNDYIFQPSSFDMMDQNLIANLLPQRRSFEPKYFETNDPKIQEQILEIQKSILNKLINPTNTGRIVNSGFYGNNYQLMEVLDDLTGSIFNQDIKSNIIPLRQNLQFEYVKLLLAIIDKDSKYLPSVQAAAAAELLSIEENLKKSKVGNRETQGHKKLIIKMIHQAFNKQ